MRRPYAFGFLATILFLAGCSQTAPPPTPGVCPSSTQAVAVSPLSAQAVAAAVPSGLGDFSPNHVPGELLAFVEQTGQAEPAGLAQAETNAGVRRLGSLGQGWLHYRAAPGNELAAAKALLAKGVVKFVQPNYIYKPLFTPNDPLYASNQIQQLNGAMRLQAAWDIEKGQSCPPYIAVLDTGITLNHEDFAGVLYLPIGANLDVVGATASSPTPDTDPSHNGASGHGTWVTGVLGAATNNLKGIAGTTMGGRIIPIKVYGDDNTGTSATIASGIDLAISLKARVINISSCLADASGGCLNTTDPAMESKIKTAHDQGRVVVASAGNDNNNFVGYPASSVYAIAAGAINSSTLARSTFSNYGSALDLMAPGGDCATAACLTATEYVTTTHTSGGYEGVIGTSFSSPFVAGTVALFMSKYGKTFGQWPSWQRVYSCLTSTAEDLGPPGFDNEYGYGLVRIDLALTNSSSCMVYP